jgi:hypothetical protein
MSIKGDMVQALRSKFLIGPEQAEDILRTVFEVADGPDFAYRYARDNHPQDPDAHLMEYWDVINVLKESI